MSCTVEIVSYAWSKIAISIAVEDSYDGPRMNEETKTIDKEFLDQMIKRLKDQKKIHKKYVFRVDVTISPTLILCLG